MPYTVLENNVAQDPPKDGTINAKDSTINRNYLHYYFTIDYKTPAYNIVAFSILEGQYYQNSIRTIPPTENRIAIIPKKY